MITYMASLTSDQLLKLKANSIEVFPHDGHYLIFGHDVLAQVCDTLQVVVEKQRDLRAAQNIKFVEFRAATAEDVISARVAVTSWHGSSSRNDFLEVAEEYLVKALDKLDQEFGSDVSVIIHHHKGRSAAPINDGNFHIHLHSSPSGAPINSLPEEIYGFKTSGRERAFPATGTGVAFIDDNHWEAAELIGSLNFYVHHHISSGRGNEGKKTFKYLIKELVKVLQMSPEKRSEYCNEALEANNARQCQEYIELCERSVSSDIGKLENAFQKKRQALENAQSALTRASSDVEAVELELVELRKAQEEQVSNLQEEFKRINNMPEVSHVSVNRNALVLATNVIFAHNEDTGEYHRLGSYRIELRFKQTESDTVRMFRSEGLSDYQVERPKKQHMNAHNVDADGRPCLGNIKNTLPSLIRNYKFYDASVFAINFLKSVNTDDYWGQHIIYWPIASRDELPEYLQS